MQVRDLEDFLDELARFFRRVEKADEDNHWLACEQDDHDFESFDEVVEDALKQFVNWAEEAMNAAEDYARRGYDVDFLDDIKDYHLKAQDMLADEPSHMRGREHRARLERARKDIAAGRVQDL